MENILNEVKISLGLSSSDKDELLSSLIKRPTQRVLNYIGKKELPTELEYIVIELAIARYNLIGSEGLNSENSDGVNFSYSTNLLDPYIKDLDKWMKDNNTKSNSKVRMRLI